MTSFLTSSFPQHSIILGGKVVNWDQTGANTVPCANYTTEQGRSSHMKIADFEDRRQITASFAATPSGEFLPMQLLYAGKPDGCHPRHQFSSGFDVYHILNHCSNQETVIQLFVKISIPYVKERIRNLGAPDQTALVLLDVFSGQTTSSVHDVLE